MQHLGARRRFWSDVLLSAAFTVALVCFGAGWAYVGATIGEGEWAPQLAAAITFLLAVPVLVLYAYPPAERRWYHFVIFELCAVSGFGLPIPLVYLPWLIVNRRHQSV